MVRTRFKILNLDKGYSSRKPESQTLKQWWTEKGYPVDITDKQNNLIITYLFDFDGRPFYRAGEKNPVILDTKTTCVRKDQNPTEITYSIAFHDKGFYRTYFADNHLNIYSPREATITANPETDIQNAFIPLKNYDLISRISELISKDPEKYKLHKT